MLLWGFGKMPGFIPPAATVGPGPATHGLTLPTGDLKRLTRYIWSGAGGEFVVTLAGDDSPVTFSNVAPSTVLPLCVRNVTSAPGDAVGFFSASYPHVLTFDFTLGTLPGGAGLTRASEGSYVDNSAVLQFASNDTARFTCDPVSHDILGLLVEPARTNIAVSTQDFAASGATNRGWQALSGTSVGFPASDNPQGPDNTDSATQIYTFASDPAVYGVYQMFGSAIDPPNPVTPERDINYTLSIFGKYHSSGGYPALIVNFNNDDGVGLTAIFDVQAGTTADSGSTSQAGFDSSTISGPYNPPGNPSSPGWFRCVIEGLVVSATMPTPQVLVTMGIPATGWNPPPSTDPPFFSNDGYKANFAPNFSWDGLLYGIQIEAGDLSSYIRSTDLTQATRAEDICTIDVPDGVYDIAIVRVSGETDLTAQTVTGGFVIPTDTSPVQTVTFTPA